MLKGLTYRFYNQITGVFITLFLLLLKTRGHENTLFNCMSKSFIMHNMPIVYSVLSWLVLCSTLLVFSTVPNVFLKFTFKFLMFSEPNLYFIIFCMQNMGHTLRQLIAQNTNNCTEILITLAFVSSLLKDLTYLKCSNNREKIKFCQKCYSWVP